MRDPRVDPKPGDVLLIPLNGTPGERHQVLSVSDSEIVTQPINFVAGDWRMQWGPDSSSAEEWLEFTKDAEVIHAAD